MCAEGTHPMVRTDKVAVEVVDHGTGSWTFPVFLPKKLVHFFGEALAGTEQIQWVSLLLTARYFFFYDPFH